MRIAINARASFGSRKSGIGVYVENISLALSAIDHENQYFIITDVLPAKEVEHHYHEDVEFIQILHQPGYYRAAWDQLGLPVLLKRRNIDIVLCPKFVVPLNRPCQAVVTIHDLLYLRYPELFTPVRGDIGVSWFP